jgi:hypothetical protein
MNRIVQPAGAACVPASYSGTARARDMGDCLPRHHYHEPRRGHYWPRFRSVAQGRGVAHDIPARLDDRGRGAVRWLPQLVDAAPGKIICEVVSTAAPDRAVTLTAVTGCDGSPHMI